MHDRKKTQKQITFSLVRLIDTDVSRRRGGGELEINQVQTIDLNPKHDLITHSPQFSNRFLLSLLPEHV